MHSTQSLLFQARVRKHDSDKKARKQQRTIRMQKIYAFLFRIIDPLCAGLAGTWVINDSNEKATAILTDETFSSLSRSNIFGNALRFIGFAIVQLFKLFLDLANNVLDNVYNMFSFYNSTNVNSYINNLLGFLWIPCVISIIILGFQLIFNSQNRPDANKILQNGLIIVILVTGLPALLSSISNMTKTFVTADFNSRGSDMSNQVLASCLTDYEYLYDWDEQKFIVRDVGIRNSYTASNDYSRVNTIDINETMRYDNAANPDAPDCSKWDNRENVCWLATIVTMNSDGTYKCEHMDNPQWWEFFSDAYYYRYDIDYITCLITLGAMAVAIIFSAIKICRILWELAIYRVLAMFFSLADLHNGEKMKEIIKAFAGAFIVIAVNAVLLKFYMIFSAWLTTQNIDGFSKSVMLVSVAIAVIDGPNLCQKLIGVDAGIRSAASTVGAMYVAGKAASGAAKAGSKVGKELGEFGKDVANKGAAVGGFAAGAGSRAAGALKQRSQTPKDERKAQKQQARADKKQEKAGQKAENKKSADNEMINKQVAANAPARMAADSGYTSDSIESYKEAAGTIQAYNGMNDAQLTDMAEDAYLSTHGEQLMNEAAELQDEAAANGTEMSEKDALTSAYAGKHKDSTKVSSDGTYHNAGQQHKNKIDSLQQSQAQNGNSVTSARLDNYGKIARHAQAFRSSEQFKGVPEVQAHTAAAAKSHGRTYDPAAGSAEKIDAYQGNMSTALAHKDEIMSHAQDYMDEQKQAGHKNVSMEQAVAHVVANEEDYDMSYGFDRQYSSDIADTLVAADSMQPKKSSVTDSDERSSSRRNIRGNLSLNESLSREKQSHDRPRFSPIQSAKRGFNAGRNLGKKKK